MPFVDEDLSKLDGGGLRSKLEEAISLLKEQTGELTGYRAEKVIGAQGLSLVKPEDLSGASSLEEMQAKATQLQQEREAAQADLARSMFEKRGLQGDELDSAVQEFLNPQGTPPATQEDAFSRLNQVGTGGGVVHPNSTVNLHGIDAIEAGLEQAAKSRP